MYIPTHAPVSPTALFSTNFVQVFQRRFRSSVLALPAFVWSPQDEEIGMWISLFGGATWYIFSWVQRQSADITWCILGAQTMSQHHPVHLVCKNNQSTRLRQIYLGSKNNQLTPLRQSWCKSNQSTRLSRGKLEFLVWWYHLVYLP